MYKFYDDDNKCWISWAPAHEDLAEDIVLEVTGKVGTADAPVEVTREVADKISALYAERAPKDPAPEDDADVPAPTAEELESLKAKVEQTSQALAELMLLLPAMGGGADMTAQRGGDK